VRSCWYWRQPKKIHGSEIPSAGHEELAARVLVTTKPSSGPGMGKTQSATRELHRAVTACGQRKSKLGVQSTGENEQIEQLDAHEEN
jgi:hypothetical protein